MQKKYIENLFFNLLLVTSLFSASCKKKVDNVLNTPPRYTIDIKKGQKNYLQSFDNLFSQLRIIPLRTKNNAPIASITKAIVDGNRYYVLDKSFSQIYCFDSTGAEIAKYGNVGLANGEFQKVNDFDISGDTLAVLSNNDKAVFLFNKNTAKLIRRLDIDLFGYSISLMNDKSMLIYVNQNSNKKNSDHNIIHIDSSGNVIDRYFPYDPKVSSMSITFSGFLKKLNDTSYYAAPFTNFVYSYANGKFKQFIDWGVNSKYVQANNQQFKAIYKESIIRDPYTSYLQDVFLKNKDFLICSYQDSLNINLCYYNIKKNQKRFYMRDMIKDPKLLLVGRPQWISRDNEMLTSLTADYIYYLKTSLSDIYLQMPVEQKKIIDQITKTSNPLLISCKVKSL